MTTPIRNQHTLTRPLNDAGVTLFRLAVSSFWRRITGTGAAVVPQASFFIPMSDPAKPNASLADMQPVNDNCTITLGYEWDAKTSRIKEYFVKGSDDIWYILDDHPEIQCTPDSADNHNVRLKQLEKEDPIVQGVPDQKDWGFHVHTDIHSSFPHNKDGVHQAKKFYIAMINIIPAVLAYNRVPTKYCDPYEDIQIETLIQKIDGIEKESETPEEFFLNIRSLVGSEKYVAINLNHVGDRSYGESGTLEFRFFQSPNLPRNAAACLYFINNVLVQSKRENQDQLKLMEVSPKTLYSIINKYSLGNRVLREEFYNLFRYQGPLTTSEPNFPRKDFVFQNPESKENDLFWDIRLGEIKKIKGLLESLKKSGGIFSTTIEGYHPLDYAYLLEDKDLFDTFQTFKKIIDVGMKPYTNNFNSKNFHPSILARNAGFSGAEAIELGELGASKIMIASVAIKMGFNSSEAIEVAKFDESKRKIAIDAIKMGFNSSEALKMAGFSVEKIELVSDAINMGFNRSDAIKVAKFDERKKIIAFHAISNGFHGFEAILMADFSAEQLELVFYAKKRGFFSSHAIEVAKLNESKIEIAFKAKQLGFSGSTVFEVVELDEGAAEAFKAISLGFRDFEAIKVAKLSAEKRAIVYRAKKLGVSNFDCLALITLSAGKIDKLFNEIKSGGSMADALKEAGLGRKN